MKQNLVYSSLSNGHLYAINIGEELGADKLGDADRFGKLYFLSNRPGFMCKVIPNNHNYIEYASTWRELDALYYLGKLEGYSRDKNNTYIIMENVEGVKSSSSLLKKDASNEEVFTKLDEKTKLQAMVASYIYDGYFYLRSDASDDSVMIGDLPQLIHWRKSIRSYQFSLFPRMVDFKTMMQLWFGLMFSAVGRYPAVIFGMRRIALLLINFFLRAQFVYHQPMAAKELNEATESSSFHYMLILFVCSLALTVIIGFYITSPLLLEVFELCVIASSLSSVSAILPLLSISSVVSVVTLLIQAYSFAVVNLGLCYETIGLIMPEKAWRLYTDFEFHYATKPVCFMKRCFYSKPEDVDVKPGVWKSI